MQDEEGLNELRMASGTGHVTGPKVPAQGKIPSLDVSAFVSLGRACHVIHHAADRSNNRVVALRNVDAGGDCYGLHRQRKSSESSSRSWRSLIPMGRFGRFRYHKVSGLGSLSVGWRYAGTMAELPGHRANEVLSWLLGGDAAVQFQTYRDLLGIERVDLQRQVAFEGDAAEILAAHSQARWGTGFYQPKWTCPHYSLLELRDLGLARDNPDCVGEVAMALDVYKGRDGGFNPFGSVKESDVCVNGMFLAFGCYFGAAAAGLESVMDFVLGQQMDDGGFNCRSNRSGARVSSVHSTTSVIDGLSEYLRDGYLHRAADVREAIGTATASLLLRHLYQDRTERGPIRAEFTRLHHPARWHFDVLRGLDVLRNAEFVYDERLDDAVGVLVRQRRADGRWSGAAQYPGQAHIAYPRPREPNRWITLRVLRVLDWAAAS